MTKRNGIFEPPLSRSYRTWAKLYFPEARFIEVLHSDSVQGQDGNLVDAACLPLQFPPSYFVASETELALDQSRRTSYAS